MFRQLQIDFSMIFQGLQEIVERKDLAAGSRFIKSEPVKTNETMTVAKHTLRRQSHEL